MFRVLGQQAGLQLVRAILPEAIDVFINEAIVETVRTIVQQNANNAFKDDLSAQDNPISSLNAIRTLQRRAVINKGITKGNGADYVVSMQLEDVFFYTSFVVTYKNVDSTVACRLIELDELENTLADYCNGASWDYPVCATTFLDGSIHQNLLIYTNSSKELTSVIANYIRRPAKVRHVKGADDVHCDLPEYLHPLIVRLAVDKFLTAVGRTSRAVAQQTN